MALGMFVVPTCVEKQPAKERVEAQKQGRKKRHWREVPRAEIHMRHGVSRWKLRAKTKDWGMLPTFLIWLPRRAVVCFRSMLEQEKVVLGVLRESLHPVQLQIFVEAMMGSARILGWPVLNHVRTHGNRNAGEGQSSPVRGCKWEQHKAWSKSDTVTSPLPLVLDSLILKREQNPGNSSKTLREKRCRGVAVGEDPKWDIPVPAQSPSL